MVLPGSGRRGEFCYLVSCISFLTKESNMSIKINFLENFGAEILKRLYDSKSSGLL